MTEEEHQARAMLLGLRYHHGNGDPVYYEVDENGTMVLISMVDANTMEPLINRNRQDPVEWIMAQARGSGTHRRQRNGIS